MAEYFCPACGEQALVYADEEGARCSRCDWSSPDSTAVIELLDGESYRFLFLRDGKAVLGNAAGTFEVEFRPSGAAGDPPRMTLVQTATAEYVTDDPEVVAGLIVNDYNVLDGETGDELSLPYDEELPTADIYRLR